MSEGNVIDSGSMNDVIVVGAGLTGLACAHELQARGLRVLVLEAGRRVGGVVGTGDRNGFLFESGPNTVPAGARHVREAAEKLGLSDKLITSNAEAKRRYLFKDGGLHALPDSPLALLRTPLLSARAKLRILSEPLRRFRPDTRAPEPTFEAFLTERIGREATRTLAGAFVRGVYAAEVDELAHRYPGDLAKLQAELRGQKQAVEDEVLPDATREDAARKKAAKAADPLDELEDEIDAGRPPYPGSEHLCAQKVSLAP